jgi:hypothetical protein
MLWILQTIIQPNSSQFIVHSSSLPLFPCFESVLALVHFPVGIPGHWCGVSRKQVSLLLSSIMKCEKCNRILVSAYT